MYGQPEPFFSIITVCLNSGGLLAETVRSVMSQKFPGYELIIKDGSSTDGSVQTIEPDEKIRIISRHDLGIYDAMNQALGVARGKYILFLNSGDTFVSDEVLSKVYHLVSDEKPSLVYSDYFKGPGKSLIKSPAILDGRYLIRTMLCHQVCFFHRRCYQQSGPFDLNFRVAADYDFLVRVIVKDRQSSAYLPFPTVHYLGGGFSVIHAKRSLREVKQIRKRYFPRRTRMFFYAWYNLTFPALRIRMVERFQPHHYYRLANFFRNQK
jgi:glycosyltransferase involved in cell wall biosynthesis